MFREKGNAPASLPGGVGKSFRCTVPRLEGITRGALMTALTELPVRLHTRDCPGSPAAPTGASDNEVALIIPKGVAIPSWSKGS